MEVGPERWDDVFAARRPVRVFWNPGPPRLDVWTDDATGGWGPVVQGLAPGQATPPLPRGARLRLQDATGEILAEVSAPTLVLPAALARLGGPPGGLPGAEVVDVAVDAAGQPWVATLGGGVARVDRETLQATAWTVAEGLPSDRVLAVAAGEGVAWAGTAAGLARLEPAADGSFEVVALLTGADGLPDDYVQALLLQGEDLWVGTYRGLARVHGAPPQVEAVLEPWSVFTLVTGTDERPWVGYEGLRGLPEAEPIEGVPPDLDVYDVEALPEEGTLLASLQEGVTLLHEGERTVLWPGSGDDGAYALARVGDGVLAAGAGAGLVTVGPRGVVRTWTAADGLPSPVVNEVVPDVPWAPDATARSSGNATGAWLGTAAGLAALDPEAGTVVAGPLADLAAGRPQGGLGRLGGRAWVAGPGGIHFLGGARSGDVRRVRRAGPDVVAVLRARGATWEVHPDHVVERRFPRRVRRHDLGGPVTAAVAAAGGRWLGGPAGLHRLGTGDAPVPVPGVGRVERLRAGSDGTVWAIAGDVVVSVSPDLRVRPFFGTHRPLDLWPDGGVVWVGTDNGIDVLDRDTGRVLDLLRTADRRVAIPAVAADGTGGCWAATDGGQLVHVDGLGAATFWEPDPAHPLQVREILPCGGGGAWLLTDRGVAAVRRPASPGPAGAAPPAPGP